MRADEANEIQNYRIKIKIKKFKHSCCNASKLNFQNINKIKRKNNRNWPQKKEKQWIRTQGRRNN